MRRKPLINGHIVAHGRRVGFAETTLAVPAGMKSGIPVYRPECSDTLLRGTSGPCHAALRAERHCAQKKEMCWKSDIALHMANDLRRKVQLLRKCYQRELV